jgi:hypothetical protein
MIDELRRRAPLGAERLTGRVRRIGFQAGEAAILDDADGAASGDAKGAISMNAL